MRVLYTPNDERMWLQYYQTGGGGFTGIPYQRGYGLGSFFKGLFRTVMPVAKSALKSVGRQALSTGAEIAKDVIAGRNIKESAKQRGRQAASRLLQKAATSMQKGRGLGVRSTKRPAKTRTPKTIKGGRKKRKKVDLLGSYYDG